MDALKNALRKSALPMAEDLRRAKLRLEAELPAK